jgi:hypothetical protein
MQKWLTKSHSVEVDEFEILLSWSEFASAQPDMAEFGQKRLELNVMYIATIRPDGYPRVHPFTPFIGSGRLFAFMEPTSPKAKDLLRNRKYSMHSLVTDMNGTNGEFQIGGDSTQMLDSLSRKAAIDSCPYKSLSPPKERHILFEFKINRCFTNYYANGIANVKHWKE